MSEIGLLTQVMSDGFTRVETAIETSRKERQDQINDLHQKINDCNRHHAAVNTGFEARLAVIDSKMKNGNGAGNSDSFSWGKKLKAFGTPAIVIAAIVGFAGGLCLIGLTMARIHKNNEESKKPAVEKVVNK